MAHVVRMRIDMVQVRRCQAGEATTIESESVMAYKTEPAVWLSRSAGACVDRLSLTFAADHRTPPTHTPMIMGTGIDMVVRRVNMRRSIAAGEG